MRKSKRRALPAFAVLELQSQALRSASHVSKTESTNDSRDRWRTLALLAIAELLGMSLWFSGSAVIPSLTKEWHLSESASSWLTLSVQLGFVVGTLLSA